MNLTQDTLKHKVFFKRDWLLLTLFTIGLNLPYLAKNFFPVVDTLFGLHVFYHFYNEFYWSKDLAQWFPYGTFGISGHFLFLMQTAVHYFFIGIGGLLRISDALVWYKSSLVFEQILFLTGLYLLSVRIFSLRSTVWLVCLSGIGSIVSYSQYFFNFHIFYLLPFVLLFLLIFFEEKKPQFLWLSGLTFIGWALGNVYGLVLWLYIFSIISLFLIYKHRSAINSIFSWSFANAGLFILLAIIACIYAYFQLHAFDHISFNVFGRDPATKKVSLDIFLHYGGNPQWFQVTKSMVLGWPPCLLVGTLMDNTIYFGLLPLAFLVYGIFAVRKPLFLALIITSGLLIWFSFGGILTKLAYYLPLMHNYRHVGLVYGLVRIIFIIAAGFGWDFFWQNKKDRYWLGIGLVILSGLTITALLISDPVYQQYVNAGLFQRIAIDHKWQYFFLGRISLYLAAVIGFILIKKFSKKNPIKNSLLPSFLLIVLTVELISFQYVVYSRAPKLSAQGVSYLDTFKTKKLEFYDQRQQEPLTIRSQNAFRLTQQIAQLGGVTHAIVYNYIQFDPMLPEFRSDWWSKPVLYLLQQKSVADIEGFKRVLGWQWPKLDLRSRSIYAENESEAITALTETSQLNDLVVIQKKKDLLMIDDLNNQLDGQSNITVSDFKANQLTINAEVVAGKGAWLVYSDAYHPGWQAKVDQVKTQVYPANYGFKAIWLDKGRHKVMFFFDYGVISLCMYIIAVFSLLIVGFLIGFSAWSILRL